MSTHVAVVSSLKPSRCVLTGVPWPLEQEQVRTVELQISQRLAGATVVVAPSGEIDLASADQLRNGLVAGESDAVTSMVIDLRGVGFIDSTGIGELVGCQRRCRDAGVSLAFVVPDGTMRKILHVTGMDAVFDMHRDESAAVASVITDD